MDTISPEKRSWTMSRIRSKNTKPELLVRRYLYANGFRYRVNVATLPGKPDIVLKKYHTVIFIHGCFWHGHDCLKGKTPQTNPLFWQNKFKRNKERDLEVRNQLKDLGWNTLVIWECQLKPKTRQKTLEEISYWLNEAYLDTFRTKRPEYSISEEGSTMLAAEKNSIYSSSTDTDE